MKSIRNIILLTISCPLLAGVDREFIFDIHDATSTTEQYANEALIVPVYKTADNPLTLSGDFAGVLPDLYDKLPILLTARTLQPTDTALFSDVGQGYNPVTIIASSLGDNTCGPIALEAFRCSFARALRQAEYNGIQTVHIALPTCIDASMKQIAQEIATITHVALYEYNALKTSKPSYGVKRVCVHAHMPTPNEFKDVNIGLRLGSNLGTAICQARDWICAPSNVKTPMELANNAAQFVLPYIAKIETIIFEKEDIARMKMGGILAVAQGSEQPCALITHYMKARKPNVPTIALVGKGLTFNAAADAKTDMAGAAAIFTALNVLAYRNIPANIVIIAPLAEQVTNGSALKLGDVVTLCNGTSIEITNTAAADRLMLADALAYGIKHFNPDYIIDIATLTTSSTDTFGGSYAAIMGNNDLLLERVQQSAARTGESVWELPLNAAYAARLQSDIADRRNAPLNDSIAPAQTTGYFLQQCVGNTPWLHIDSTGAQTSQDYSPQGSSAFGVRLLIDLVESLAHEAK